MRAHSGILRALGAALALCLAQPGWAQFRAVKVSGRTGAAGRVKVGLGQVPGFQPGTLLKIAPSVVTSLPVPLTPSADGVKIQLPAEPSAALPVSSIEVLEGVGHGSLGETARGGGGRKSSEETSASESRREDSPEDLGRALFDGTKKRSGFGSILDWALGNKPVPQKTPKVSNRVRTLGLGQGTKGYSINGQETDVIGFGSYKTTVRHPEASHRVVKFFDGNQLSGPLSLRERSREVGITRKLMPLGVVPKLVDVGWFRSGERYIAFVDEEAVDGVDLDIMTPTKYKYVKALFEILIDNGVLIADLEIPLKLRANIKVGKTASGPFQAWLVDKDATFPQKMKKGRLRAIYAKALESLRPIGR